MNRTFSIIAAYRPTDFNLYGKGDPEHLEGEMISAGFFEILGVNPVMGQQTTAEARLLQHSARRRDALWS